MPLISAADLLYVAQHECDSAGDSIWRALSSSNPNPCRDLECAMRLQISALAKTALAYSGIVRRSPQWQITHKEILLTTATTGIDAAIAFMTGKELISDEARS